MSVSSRTEEEGMRVASSVMKSTVVKTERL